MPTLEALPTPKAAAPALAALHTDRPCVDCGHVRPTWHNEPGSEYYCLDCLDAYIRWERSELAKAGAARAQLAQFQRQRLA